MTAPSPLLFSPSDLPHPEISEPTLEWSGVPIVENVVLGPLTTWQVGGPARYFAEPQSPEELALVLREAHNRNVQTWVLGKGSNLVVSDRGFPGIVIYLGRSMSALRVESQTESELIIEAEAGAALWDLVRLTVDQG